MDNKRKREDAGVITEASSLNVVAELAASSGAGSSSARAEPASAAAAGAVTGAGADSSSDVHAILLSLGIASSHPSFTELFKDEAAKAYFKSLIIKLRAARASSRVFPPPGRELAAVSLIAGGLANVRVIILGQDPYHGPNQAHGLSFSVPVGVAIPPSLRNILKEVGGASTKSANGNLEGWARQGVLLLNTVLTVASGQANSHAGSLGWESLTDAIVKAVSRLSPHCAVMLWGAHAQAKRKLIDSSRHLILEAPHPSPLSAYRGFLGCGHFTKTNEFLKSHGLEVIDWKI